MRCVPDYSLEVNSLIELILAVLHSLHLFGMQSVPSSRSRPTMLSQWLSLLLALLPVSLALSAAAPGTDDYLKPIHWEDYQAAYTGIQRRQVNPTAYKLSDEVHLIYGRSNGDDSALLANLHIRGNSKSGNRKILVLEDLDPLLRRISCKDGVIDITFNSAGSAQDAHEHWVQQIQDRSDATSIIVITNHKGCGGDKNQRHPFLVSDVASYDETTLTVSLHTEELDWSEVIGDVSLEFGQQKMAKPKLFLSRRDHDDKLEGEDGFNLDNLNDWFENAKDTITPDWIDYENKEKTISVSWDLESGAPGNVTSLYPISNPILAGVFPSIKGLELGCTNCYTRGALKLSGYLRTEHWEVEELQLHLEVLEKLEAVTELNIVAEKELGTLDLPQLTLFDSSKIRAPISFSGIHIQGIFEVGPALQIGLGMGFKIGSNVNITAGIATGVNEGAKITLDLVNYDKSEVTDWNFSWDPSFAVEGVEDGLTIDTFVETSLNFGVKIGGGKNGKIKSLNPQELIAALKLKVPNLSTEFAIGYKANGYCEGEEGKTGITAKPAVKAELGFEIARYVAGGSRPDILYERDLFELDLKELDESCMPHKFSDEKTLELKAKAEEEGRRNRKPGAVLPSSADPDKPSSGDRMIPAGTSFYVVAVSLVAMFFFLL